MFARKLVAALPAAIARRCPLAMCSRPRELACFETLAWSGSRWCCKHDVGRAVHVREGTDSRPARRQQHTSQPFNRAVPQPHVLSRVLAPTLPALPCTESQGPSGRAKSGTHSEACLRRKQSQIGYSLRYQYSASTTGVPSTSGSSCFAAKLRQWSNT